MVITIRNSLIKLWSSAYFPTLEFSCQIVSFDLSYLCHIDFVFRNGFLQFVFISVAWLPSTHPTDHGSLSDTGFILLHLRNLMFSCVIVCFVLVHSVVIVIVAYVHQLRGFIRAPEHCTVISHLSLCFCFTFKQ